MRETVYLFTMCKDNNSGLMHQELKFLWMNSYRLTRNICCGSDSVWDALHAEQLPLLIFNVEMIHDSCFQPWLYMLASKKADSCATLGMWNHFHQPKLIDVTSNCWKEMTNGYLRAKNWLVLTICKRDRGKKGQHFHLSSPEPLIQINTFWHLKGPKTATTPESNLSIQKTHVDLCNPAKETIH